MNRSIEGSKLFSGLPGEDGMMGQVRRACMRYVQNRAEADDLAQEILIKVFRGRALVGDRSWWLRVAANHCLDHLRKEKRRASRNAAYALEWAREAHWEANREGAGPDPEKSAGRLERLRARLGEADRKLVHLRFDLGLRQ